MLYILSVSFGLNARNSSAVFSFKQTTIQFKIWLFYLFFFFFFKIIKKYILS